MTTKAPGAFRTIGEVSDLLATPAHVLRFWESRFPQIKPVKRAGGRRYYRPADVALLGGIKRLLHEDGMTIRGVQKLLRDQGVRHVCALAPEGASDGTPVMAPEPSAPAEPVAPAPPAEVQHTPPPARIAPPPDAGIPQRPATLLRGMDSVDPRQAAALRDRCAALITRLRGGRDPHLT